MPAKPEGLSESASRYWDELLIVMATSGISLIPGDASIVAMAATLKADLSAAWEIVKRDGRYITTKTGVMKIHPAVEDTAKLNEKLSKCLWQLGLTPKSRGNQVKAVESSEPDELAFLNDDEPPKTVEQLQADMREQAERYKAMKLRRQE